MTTFRYKKINTKFLSVTALLVFVSTCANAQTEENYFITKKGEKVYMYENTKNKTYWKYDHQFNSAYALTGQYFWYHDKNGNLKQKGQASLKEIHWGNRYYVNKRTKPGGRGPNRMHEILVVTDKYTLSEYYEGGRFLAFVYDNETGEDVLNKWYSIEGSQEGDKVFLNNVVKDLFKQCTELIKHLEENLENNYDDMGPSMKRLFRGVQNYHCH